MARRFTVETLFKGIDGISKPLTRMRGKMNRFTRGVTRGLRSVNRGFKTVKRTITSMGIKALAVFASMAFALKNILGAGAGFEQAITNVGAVSLKTREQIKPLEDLALKLGKTTKFTATQAAEAMEVMARAGFSINDTLKATPAVLSAAAASGLEIADVANHVSNALKGMGLETSEAGRVADVLALASSKTNSSIGSLGESISKVASTARRLNIPLEDVVASVALLQDVGLDASVAGSAFNVMFTKMAKPSKSMKEKMDKLSLSFKKLNGDMKTLPTVLKELGKATEKVGGNFDQVAFLSELVGSRGEKAAGNLTDLFNAGRTSTLTADLKDALGTSEKMAKLRMNTVTGSMLLFGSAVDAVKVKIFGMNAGPLKDTIDSMTEWVGVNEELIASKIGDFIGKLIDNLPAIVSGVKEISSNFMGFIKVMGDVFRVMSIFKNAVMRVWNALFDGIASITVAPLELLNRLISSVKTFKSIMTVGLFKKFGIDFNPDKTQRDKEIIESSLGGAADGAGAVSSPQERISKTIEESRSTQSAELTIKDETGRAQLTNKQPAPGIGLSLAQSGVF